MSSRFAIWLVCAGVVALACGPHGRHDESAASTTDDPSAHGTAAGDPRILATTANVTVHGGVRFTLHITNVSDHAVQLDFPNGQTHDFVVVDSLGREVWRWSSGRMFTQALRTTLLGANETLTYQERWPERGRRGAFTAVALLKSSNHPVAQRVPFSLP